LLRNPIPICIALALLGTLAFRIQHPAISFYAREILHASALDIGLLTASFMIARAISSIVAGWVYRYRSIAKLLPATCFVANAVVALVYMYVRDVASMILLRAVQGILNGLAWVTIQVVLGEAAPRNLRATLYSIYFAVGSMGIALANYVYSCLSAVSVDPTKLSLAISSLTFVAAALLALLMPYVEPRKKEGISSRGSLGLALSIMLFSFSISLAISFPVSEVVYIYVKEVFSMSKSSVTAMLATAMLVATIIGLILSMVADRLSEKLSLMIVAVLMVSGVVAALIDVVYAMAIALTLLLSISRASISISRRIAVSRLGPRGVGYVNAANNIGSVVGSITIGMLYDAFGAARLPLDGVSLSLTLLAFYVPILIVAMVSIVVVCRYLD